MIKGIHQLQHAGRIAGSVRVIFKDHLTGVRIQYDGAQIGLARHRGQLGGSQPNPSNHQQHNEEKQTLLHGNHLMS
jgi:hypothetical protein